MTPNAAQVMTSIERRHAKDRGMVFEEIDLPAGSGRHRRVDALVIVSQGVIVYEVKVTRSDFLAELRDLDKRTPAERYALQTWFAAPYGLIDPSELPEGWGLLEVFSTGRTRRKRAAVQRSSPAPLPYHVHQQLLRRAFAATNPYEEVWKLPPRVPVKAWTYRGQEIGRDELLDLVGEVCVEEMTTADSRAQLEARGELWAESLSLQPLRSLLAQLRVSLGLGYGATVDDVVAAINSGTRSLRMAGGVERRLRQLHSELGQMLEAPNG